MLAVTKRVLKQLLALLSLTVQNIHSEDLSEQGRH